MPRLAKTLRMPLLDHFHPPLHGPRRWEGFHHAWATFIAQQLNQQTLPAGYFAESEISLGAEFEIDVAALQERDAGPSDADTVAGAPTATAVWSPPQPALTADVSFAQLDSYEIKVYQDLGGAELRGAIELVSPANKDRPGSRRTFAAKCAGYVRHGIGLVIIDVVTARSADLHAELMDVLETTTRPAAWKSPTGLYAVAYRPVTLLNAPRLEMWPEALAVGQSLPVLPLWLALDLCVPLRLEDSYLATCQSLRISAA
jgi:hypothetical protein